MGHVRLVAMSVAADRFCSGRPLQNCGERYERYGVAVGGNRRTAVGGVCVCVWGGESESKKARKGESEILQSRGHQRTYTAGSERAR